jgi:AcrR family transcriptional regulator
VAEARAPLPGRKGEILDLFTEKVAAQGYDMTSLREIAEDLLLSKGTIVHHFGTKESMLQQLSNDYMTRRLAELHAILKSDPTPHGRVGALIVALITAHRDDRASTLAFSREFIRFMKEPVMNVVLKQRREYVKLLEGVIKQGIKDGVFRATDPKVSALQIIGMCTWAWTWFRPEGRLAAEDVGRIFAQNVLGGMLAGAAGENGVPALPAAVRALRSKARKKQTEAR